jgi:hypothetical protein
MAGHFRKGTPGDGLDVVLHVPPLDLYIRGEIIRSYYRLRDQLVGPHYKQVKRGHLAVAKALFTDCDLPDFPTDRIPPLTNKKRGYTVSTASFSSGRIVDSDRLAVYTDGSKNSSGHSGYGVAIMTHEYASLDFQA